MLFRSEACQATAAEIGPATSLVVQTLLDDPVVDRLPTVGRLLRLRLKYNDERLEAACVRALTFGDPMYRTVKGILQRGTEKQPVPEIIPSPPATAFVRPAEELFGTSLLEECSSPLRGRRAGAGGETWN